MATVLTVLTLISLANAYLPVYHAYQVSIYPCVSAIVVESPPLKIISHINAKQQDGCVQSKSGTTLGNSSFALAYNWITVQADREKLLQLQQYDES